MKLVTQDESGVLHPTVSGILMTCYHPEEFLPSAFIQCILYKGLKKVLHYQIDARDVTGPLDIQIRDACLFVERNTRVYATKNPTRKETPQFSRNAVFEAITNAVAHRDYSVYGSKIRLHIFLDRIELFSPGTLPNTMSVESLSERQSSRNELICSLLARTPINYEAYGSKREFIMDQRGEGVPIIVIESEELSNRLLI